MIQTTSKYDFVKTKKSRVLILSTGSVATVKVPLIYSQLIEEFDVRVAITETAKHFLPDDFLEKCYDDSDNFKICKWADLVLICPLDACTLGKIACGICNNLITEIVRAFPLGKPLVFCLAMNTNMYYHPITTQHVQILKSWGYREIEPVIKALACGDYGMGGLCSSDVIVETVKKILVLS
ncbi:Phosphopantothenoylcysteine decarboxylase [Thelohanellus kitauei]|uniref:Phosphopantothenoylcysteine decarboxylase n=1 Tax=Thelohanellus kitauei TaxID=669202 RepID=A0A0C2J8B3_THEKT|nr:Phosphopantothenoylcysteine decarboxylase [Thelohanellus kitauei]